MNRAKLLSVLAAATFTVVTVSTAALAGDDSKERNVRGIYGGAGVGAAWHEDGGSPEAAWRFMAWVRPIKYLSIEMGYFDLGNNDLGQETRGFAFSGVPTYPIGPFDVYGKVGFAVATIDDNTQLEPTFGAGGAYQWKRLGARLEYERFQFDDSTNVGWLILYYQLGDI